MGLFTREYLSQNLTTNLLKNRTRRIIRLRFYDILAGNGEIQLLLQLLHRPLQFVLEVVVATDGEVFSDAAAVGRDGLVVGDAVELEEVLQTVEVGVGEADGLLAG